MELGLKDKVAVVTGASNGIGRAIAMELAGEGALVIIAARRPAVLTEAEQAIARVGRVESKVLDVTDSTAYGQFLHDVIARHGRIDILVNNAGHSAFGPIEAMTFEDWHATYRLVVDATFASLRVVLPAMRAQGGGSVINITSVMGVRSQTNSSAYGSAKAALQQLTNIAAVEGGPHNVRVNTVQVGSVETEGTRGYTEAYPELAALVAKAIPMRRWGDPREVSGAVAFLASDRASFITGACLAIDGALGIAFPY